MTGPPRISFGTIVLNGEPFTRYCLRGLYPFAHQIIVVEGATRDAAAVAGTDGHSTDGTVETLRDFKAREDPQDKLIIVAAEDHGHPDGFWPGEKDEQSRAFARRATGDYLWQVDIDEFYKARDMQTVLDMLRDRPDITAVSFKQVTFWGGFEYVTDGWYLRRGADVYHRLFKWGERYRYVTHRPPTVHDPDNRDLRSLRWVQPRELCKRGIKLYHYSLLFPKQVMDKARYYAAGPWGQYSRGVLRWAEENFLSTIRRPFQAHNLHTYPSWLERYDGRHPEQVECMRRDLESGRLQIACRDNRDIERLLSLRSYRLGRWLLRPLWPMSAWRYSPRKCVTRNAHRVTYDCHAGRLGFGG